MKLEDWEVITSGDQYTAPEHRRMHLSGLCPDHPNERLRNQRITTSAVKAKHGETVLTNSGSAYDLGTPRKEYAEQCPDAKVRLLKSLPHV